MEERREDTRSYAASDGTSMAVHSWIGSADLTPLVCLHSLFFSGLMFRDLVETLDCITDSRPCVLAPDLRGQGGSPLGQRVPLMRVLAEDVLEMMDARGIDRAHVLGSSMGGYVAMELMEIAPDRLDHVVLSCCTGQPETDPARFEHLAQRLQTEGAEALADVLCATMFGAPFVADGTDALQRWRTQFKALPPAIATVVRGVFAHPGYGPVLAGFPKPVLAIGGGEDRAKRPEHAQWIAERAAQGQFAEITRAGHTPPVEAPEDYTRLVANFLQLRTTSNT